MDQKKLLPFSTQANCSQGNYTDFYGTDYKNFCNHRRRRHDDAEPLKDEIIGKKNLKQSETAISDGSDVPLLSQSFLLDESSDEDDEYTCVTEDDAFYSIASFALRLQAIENIPAVTIQNIIDSLGEIIHLTLSEIQQKCKMIMVNSGISCDTINSLSDCFASTTVETSLLSNGGRLATHKRRELFFTKNFAHVAPGKIFL